MQGDSTHCLQCGRRLVETAPARTDWRLPAAIVAAIAVLCVAGLVYALARVESDAEKEAAKPAPAVTQPEPERR